MYMGQSKGWRTITTHLHPRSTFPISHLTCLEYLPGNRQDSQVLLSEEHSRQSDFGHEAPGLSEAWGYHWEVMIQVSH